METKPKTTKSNRSEIQDFIVDKLLSEHKNIQRAKINEMAEFYKHLGDKKIIIENTNYE